MQATKGDWLVVESSVVDRSSRRGLILDAEGPDGTPPFLVRSVVRLILPRRAPCRPRVFISRSTVQRATLMPRPLRSSSHIFRAP